MQATEEAGDGREKIESAILIMDQMGTPGEGTAYKRAVLWGV